LETINIAIPASLVFMQIIGINTSEILQRFPW